MDTCQGFVSVCLRLVRACWDSAQSCNIFHFHGCFDRNWDSASGSEVRMVLEGFFKPKPTSGVGGAQELKQTGVVLSRDQDWKTLTWGTFSFIKVKVTVSTSSSLFCLPRITVFSAPTTQNQGVGGVCSLHSCNLSAAVTGDAGKQVPITGISWHHQMMCSD